MLDVGCGGGFFLRRAYDRGWYCVGVEPNDVAREYAQKRYLTHGGTFYEKSLDAVKENRFWGIHLSEVLEHLPNPLEMLKDCYDRLMVGGSLCVVVPNEKFTHDGKLIYPHVFAPPHHINYFSFDSITDLIKQAGFEIYEVSAMYPMETFLEMGLYYTFSEWRGRLCHQMRKNFDLAMTPQERRTFYRNLAKHHEGREAVIYAVKK
jgi:2-polyprenyl-3-methyl-5-hydroxy-6-metoxy-1,4-benzoquinol methylase